MDAAVSSERIAKRVDGRGKHLHRARRLAAPRQSRGQRGTLGECGDGLFPWDIYDYPGLLAGLSQIYGNRASKHTIRDWIRGKRKPPQWAWVLLLHALERRRQELDHAIEQAKKEAGL